MARKLRVEYAGAIYHVMNRGDRRERIFMDDADRRTSGDGHARLSEPSLVSPEEAGRGVTNIKN